VDRDPAGAADALFNPISERLSYEWTIPFFAAGEQAPLLEDAQEIQRRYRRTGLRS